MKIFNLNIYLGISIKTSTSINSLVSPGSTARLNKLKDYVAKVKPLADAVIATQAGLTDSQKIQAELFNAKDRSFLPAIAKLVDVQLNSAPLTYDNFITVSFATALAAWDAALLGFKSKIFWNSVRPVTAIRYLYDSKFITTWVKNQGAVSIPGRDFKPYINTAPHTTYPSTSTIYFVAFASAAKEFFGSDTFSWSYDYAAGKSTVESNLTPVSPVTITVTSFTEYAFLGGQARFLGGGKCHELTFVCSVFSFIHSFIVFAY